MAEIYVSVDIESDGPSPGRNSMLAFGAAAFERGNRTPIDCFEINLKPLPDATPDPNTMSWWKGQPEAWKYITTNPVSPELGMKRFSNWLHGLPGKAVLTGYPMTFDFTFLYWYHWEFVGKPVFGFQGLDIKTLAMDRLGIDFRQAVKRRFPKGWFRECCKHTHKPLDDAIGQGVLLINILDTPRCQCQEQISRNEFQEALQRILPEDSVRPIVEHGELDEVVMLACIRAFLAQKSGPDVEIIRRAYNHFLKTGKWLFTE